MRLTYAFTGVVVAHLLMTLLTVVAAQGTRGGRRRQTAVGPYRDLATLLGNNNLEDLSSFTPSPPALEDVECHVEIRRTEQVGGRCIQLGANSIHACQAGAHLDPFSHDCERQNGGNRNRFRNRGHSVRRPFRGRSAGSASRTPHA